MAQSPNRNRRRRRVPTHEKLSLHARPAFSWCLPSRARCRAAAGRRGNAADPATAPPSSTGLRRTAAELDQLLAPIALYPDALIALILPAATVPTDIVLAARHLRDNPGDASQIEHRAWDDSVKSLTHYPDVVKWMDENLHWTKQVGEAFAEQPAEVMQSVQRLRAKARAAGTLVDTPQQLVLAEPQVIRIVPAQPDIIYVPYYEPEIVFVDRPGLLPAPIPDFRGRSAGGFVARVRLRLASPHHLGRQPPSALDRPRLASSRGADWTGSRFYPDTGGSAMAPTAAYCAASVRRPPPPHGNRAARSD